VRSTSLGVRIDDPDAPARERVVLVSDGPRGLPAAATSPAWLLLLAALIGAGVTLRVLAGRRRREDDDAADVERPAETSRISVVR